MSNNKIEESIPRKDYLVNLLSKAYENFFIGRARLPVRKSYFKSK